jgi:hypothetical protein
MHATNAMSNFEWRDLALILLVAINKLYFTVKPSCSYYTCILKPHNTLKTREFVSLIGFHLKRNILKKKQSMFVVLGALNVM